MIIYPKNLDYTINNSENFKLKKLQSISTVIQNKIYILNIRSTLNNIYVTVTNNFGKIIFLNSGGTSKVISSKRNTNYTLELILNALLKKLVDLNIRSLLINLDLASIKKKKVVIKVLQKFQIKIIGLQLNTIKAFNGVRPCKRRRI